MTIDALGKCNGIQNLKITNLHGHLLFDSADPALLAGVDDDDDDDDTSLAGVQGDDTSLAGVPIPIMTNDDNDDLNKESNHNSFDSNEADDTSSPASVHSTGSQAPGHNMTDEPPQLPPDDEELDNTQLPELETQVSALCQSERVSVPPSDYIPQMGGKTYAMNKQKTIKTKTKV